MRSSNRRKLAVEQLEKTCGRLLLEPRHELSLSRASPRSNCCLAPPSASYKPACQQMRMSSRSCPTTTASFHFRPRCLEMRGKLQVPAVVGVVPAQLASHEARRCIPREEQVHRVKVRALLKVGQSNKRRNPRPCHSRCRRIARCASSGRTRTAAWCWYFFLALRVATSRVTGGSRWCWRRGCRHRRWCNCRRGGLVQHVHVRGHGQDQKQEGQRKLDDRECIKCIDGKIDLQVASNHGGVNHARSPLARNDDGGSIRGART